ncbi:MAG: GNA1162 family protein [Desulfobacter sp.]
MKKKTVFSVLLLCLLCTSCVTVPKTTKLSEFPLMYEEQISSILILPPMNETTAADAKEYYATTIQEPLTYSGYYVFPYPVTSEILQMEGIYDSELLMNTPLSKFREFFGADAVLFTRIKKWDMSYVVIDSNLTVSVECQLKSTSTNRVLWAYDGTVTVNLSGGGSSTGHILGDLIAKAITTAINSAMADYVPYARKANYLAISSLPYGKYHPQHTKDKQMEIIDQTPQPQEEAASESATTGESAVQASE